MTRHAAPPRLEIRCFGSPTLRLDGGPPPPQAMWRKHLALLVYLALSPGRTRAREHLMGLLWPEKTQAHARHSLNETLRRLRGCLGTGRLLSRGDAITLDDRGLDVDALRFEAAADANPAEAATLLSGDFLEGFNLDDAPGFEEWAAVERSRFRAHAAAVLVAVGEAALANSRFGEAERAARRALALQPYAESAVRLLMRGAAVVGDQAGALAAYHEFRERLGSELGEKPGRELETLSERIRGRRWRRAPVGVAEDETPLVGREDALRSALTLVAAAATRGLRLLLISGEAGMGKTRLLGECLDRLALDGAAIAFARPLESDHDAPWSTLRGLMRGRLLAAPGSAAADPGALAVLAALVPELAGRAEPREPRDHADVGAALASLFRAVAEEQSLAVAVDDAGYADASSLAALRAAAGAVRGLPILFVLTSAPPAPDAPAELLRWYAAVGRDLPGGAVRLGPLPEQALQTLIERLAPWCGGADRDRLARRLAFETGGNPFLADALLRALREASALRQDVLTWPPPQATLERPLPISVPSLARMGILARVAQLDDESRLILQTASLLGRALDPALVAAVADLPRPTVEGKLPILESRRLVAFDGERYVFEAALIAEIVRAEGMPAGQRRRLRARAIEVLGARQDLESRVLRVELLARTQPDRQAFDEAIAVGRVALQAGSVRTARRAVAAAERCREADPACDRGAVDALRRALDTG
ncbi:MAG: AAA family ATPase [Gemmatimonadetes bacterium]|nr:AAA family ATPase [Gemmatimonadota bacterium]